MSDKTYAIRAPFEHKIGMDLSHVCIDRSNKYDKATFHWHCYPRANARWALTYSPASPLSPPWAPWLSMPSSLLRVNYTWFRSVPDLLWLGLLFCTGSLTVQSGRFGSGGEEAVIGPVFVSPSGWVMARTCGKNEVFDPEQLHWRLYHFSPVGLMRTGTSAASFQGLFWAVQPLAGDCELSLDLWRRALGDDVPKDIGQQLSSFFEGLDAQDFAQEAGEL